MESVDTPSTITDSVATTTLFHPDDHHRPSRRRRPKLCGRDKERAQLSSVFSRAAVGSSAAAVFVHGESGSGKTSLVEDLREQVVVVATDDSGEEGINSNVYFCSGKYFQDSGTQEPHSAILAAFSDLCDIVLQQQPSSSDDESWRAIRRQIKKGMGSDGALLSRAVTSLSTLLRDDESHDDDAKPLDNIHNRLQEENLSTITNQSEAAFLQFKVACKTFLHVMSSSLSDNNLPIVLFIDDIQWMDEGSKQLLQAFLKDETLTNVLIILSYRDEEADKITDFLSTEIKLKVEHIHVGLLDSVGIHSMLSELLHVESDGNNNSVLKHLAEIVAQKTFGNPFHALQLLDFIQDEGFLTHTVKDDTWNLDADQIISNVMVSESVADLLAHKIKILPQEVKDTLKAASLIGYRFDYDILFDVASVVAVPSAENDNESETFVSSTATAAETVRSSLITATDNHIIEKTRLGYQFSHDKLQAAFRSLLSSHEEQRYHLALGEAFLERSDQESRFHAASHLNQVSEYYFDTEEKRVRLAKINLEASKVCDSKSAFRDAAIFLHQGLELLKDGNADSSKEGRCSTMWETQFDLKFEMTEMLAQMELINGNIEVCQEMTNEAKRRAKSMEMQVKCLLIEGQAHMAANEVDECIESVNQSLKLLGTKLPRKVRIWHILGKLLKVRRLVRRMTDDEIRGLPVIEDRVLSTRIRMLAFNSLNYAFKGDLETLGFLALSAAELTLTKGLAPYSGYSLAMYASFEVVLGKTDRAFRISSLALQIQWENNWRESECQVVALHGGLVAHYKQSLREIQDVMLRGIEVGFETGEIRYVLDHMSACFHSRILYGENLEDLEKFMLYHYRRCCDLTHDVWLMWTKPAIQYVLNMRGDGAATTNWRTITELTGEVMEEATYMRDAFAGSQKWFQALPLIFKIDLAYHFEFYSLGAKAIEDTMDLVVRNAEPAMNVQIRHYTLFSASTYYALYRNTKKRKFLRQARRFKNKLVRFHSHGSKDSVAEVMFLEAEDKISRCSSPTSEQIISEYSKAAAASAKEEFIHLEAMSKERAGFALVELGQGQEARAFFDQALELYLNGWGAQAKHDWLQERSTRELKRLGLRSDAEAGIPVGEYIVVGGDS